MKKNHSSFLHPFKSISCVLIRGYLHPSPDTSMIFQYFPSTIPTITRLLFLFCSYIQKGSRGKLLPALTATRAWHSLSIIILASFCLLFLWGILCIVINLILGCCFCLLLFVFSKTLRYTKCIKIGKLIYIARNKSNKLWQSRYMGKSDIINRAEPEPQNWLQSGRWHKWEHSVAVL